MYDIAWIILIIAYSKQLFEFRIFVNFKEKELSSHISYKLNNA